MWTETENLLPEQDRDIIGMDTGGVEHKLRFHGNKFWTRDMGMYVYFCPVRWKYDDW